MKVRYNERFLLSSHRNLDKKYNMESHPVKTKGSVFDSIEYKRALEAMDEILADEQTVSVPVDEDGRDARIEKYIL